MDRQQAWDHCLTEGMLHAWSLGRTIGHWSDRVGLPHNNSLDEWRKLKRTLPPSDFVSLKMGLPTFLGGVMPMLLKVLVMHDYDQGKALAWLEKYPFYDNEGPMKMTKGARERKALLRQTKNAEARHRVIQKIQMDFKENSQKLMGTRRKRLKG